LGAVLQGKAAGVPGGLDEAMGESFSGDLDPDGDPDPDSDSD